MARRSLFVAVSSVLGVLAALAPVAAAAAAPAPAAPAPATPAPTAVAWAPCVAPMPAGLQCGSVPVPLEYGGVGGRTIDLALYRAPAQGAPAARRGSLFVNPGGPGGTGGDFLAFLVQVLPAELRAAYDLIAFDPRGVGASDGLGCGVGVAFPYSLGEDPVAEALASGRALGEACLAEDAELVAAMGTVNVARDLDRARAAVGAERLDYLGFSYGTRIGAVYATLFPERVGRFVLDGVVDPRQSYRTAIIDQMASFEDALHRFFDACDHEPGCALGGTGPGGTEARFRALFGRAATEGLPVAGGEERLDASELVSGFVGYLYGGHRAFEPLAETLAAAEAGDASQLAADAAGSVAGAIGQYFAVMCADADAVYGRSEANFATWALRDRAEVFRPAALEILFCAGFPDAREPVADFNGEGLPAALVLGNTHDPATPYAAAVSLRELWPSASLVTYEGDGHTIAFNGSTCADDAVIAFLVRGELAADGTRCRPDPVLGVFAIPTAGGLRVVGIDPATPAAERLQPADVITAIGGAAATVDALAAAAATGGPFEVTVLRAGATSTVTLQASTPPYWRP